MLHAVKTQIFYVLTDNIYVLFIFCKKKEKEKSLCVDSRFSAEIIHVDSVINLI